MFITKGSKTNKNKTTQKKRFFNRKIYNIFGRRD